MVDRQQWSRVHSVRDLRRILIFVTSLSPIDCCTSFTSLTLTYSGVELNSCGVSFHLYSFHSVLPLVFTFLFLFLPSIFAFPPTLFIYLLLIYFLCLFSFFISYLVSAIFIFSVYFYFFPLIFSLSANFLLCFFFVSSFRFFFPRLSFFCFFLFWF